MTATGATPWPQAGKSVGHQRGATMTATGDNPVSIDRSPYTQG
jgi:hypothetical protein